MPPAICCRDLRKQYPGKPPTDAVNGLDLAIEVGECFGLLGPNGAGKTTTIEILEGLLEPTAGVVEILGRRWHESADAIRPRIGISLQETKLSERLTVHETVTLFGSFYSRALRPLDVMRSVSLEDKAMTWVKKLSGGQRQRLAVACALVGDPELVFLDEPTTGLDPQSRRQLWDIIRQFRVQSRTVLLTTHYMHEAELLCDRVAIVDRGKVIALGSPRELIAGLGGEHVITFSLADPTAAAYSAMALCELPAVRSARLEAQHYSLNVTAPHIAIPALLTLLRSGGHELASLTTRHASLEDVFVTLTGRHLRDQAET